MGKFNQKEFNNFILENNVIGFFDKPIKLKSGRMSHWYVNWRNVAEDVFLLDKLTDYIIAFTQDLGLEPECFYGVPEGATKIGVIAQIKNPIKPEGILTDKLEYLSLQWINNVAEEILKGLNEDVTCIYGDPKGTSKFVALVMHYYWAKKKGDGKGYPFPMGRTKPKSHGHPKDRYFIGIPRGKTLVLVDDKNRKEDVVKPLEELGIDIYGMVELRAPKYVRSLQKIVVIEDVTTTGSSLLTTIDKLAKARAPVIAAYGLTNRMELRDDGQSVQEAVESKGIPYYALSNALKLLPEACRKLNPGEDIAKAIEEEFKKHGVEKLKLRG